MNKGAVMDTVKFGRKTYEIDPLGFLLDFKQWDEDFAEGMAANLSIPQGLTVEHWDVIYFIRNMFEKTGRIPLVYQVCRRNGLNLQELKKLFPTGYQRGACRLAGVTYKEGYVERAWSRTPDEKSSPFPQEKTYEVDVRGFLVVPEDWDEQYAAFKAFEMKMPEPLTERHWQIICFLRDSYQKNKVIPTVYETCEANHLPIEELERLFPDGFHRGAVKIAGLRVR
jgi:tRNA 2-thiouridine synthesizing protein E